MIGKIIFLISRAIHKQSPKTAPKSFTVPKYLEYCNQKYKKIRNNSINEENRRISIKKRKVSLSEKR